jgi:hypothetical protein
MLPTSNVILELDIDNKRGRVIDNSDYDSVNIDVALANAKGLGIVTVNNTAVFNGSLTSNPLVNLAVSNIGQWFNLPLDSNGNVLNGTYAFTYSLNFTATGAVNSVTATNSANLEFSNAGEILASGDSIVFTGNTETANNGTFTIATVTPDTELDSTAITVTQTTLVTEAEATGTYSFNVTRANFGGDVYTFNGCDFVNPKVQVTYDCDSTRFGTITFQDVTDYKGQSFVRDLEAFYPRPLNPLPETPSVSTNLPSITMNELAVGTYAYELELTMSVTQPDGLVYTYTVVDTGETKVTCIGSLCSINPCLESLKDTFFENYNNGTGANLVPLVTLVNQLLALAIQYKECGDNQKYAETVIQLQGVLDVSGQCNCGCDESGKDVPYWVDNANLVTPSIFEQLLEEIALLEVQINGLQQQINQTNANVSNLSSVVNNIQIELGNLEQALQEDAEALLAYQTLVANISALANNILNLSIQANTIQAQINALNPNSPTFADDVAFIETLLVSLNSAYGVLQTELADVTQELLDFNTDYPDYISYTVNAAIYLSSASNALDSIEANIDALEALLASLTPTTYAADIADIQDEINLIWSLINTTYGFVISMSWSIQSINETLVDIQEQITNLQEQINLIPTNIVSSKVQPLFADVNTNFALVGVVDKYTTKGGYFKVIVKGQDLTDAGCEITISNNETSYVLFNEEVGTKSYEIEFIVIVNLSAVPFTFKIGGALDLGNTLQPINVTGINSTTEIVYAEGFNLKIESNSVSNVFNSIEVYGYDLTFN